MKEVKPKKRITAPSDDAAPAPERAPAPEPEPAPGRVPAPEPEPAPEHVSVPELEPAPPDVVLAEQTPVQAHSPASPPDAWFLRELSALHGRDPLEVLLK